MCSFWKIHDNSAIKTSMNIVLRNIYLMLIMSGYIHSGQDDKAWMKTAINDVAYFIRGFKFNELDVRKKWVQNGTNEWRLYEKFPEPLLRVMHWEVRQFCEHSFESCVKYLNYHISTTIKATKRTDDTSTAMVQNGWSMTKNLVQIQKFDSQCKKRKQNEKRTNVINYFSNQYDRFQWIVTASYYMCWYTFKGTEELKHFGLTCDNFANCLDWLRGPQVKDIRARDAKPFQCATFSFCPDPCCPLKLATDINQCKDHYRNPCFSKDKKISLLCTLSMNENDQFNGLLHNRWNTTCQCSGKGVQWSSKYGICIDINECKDGKKCDRETESCLNLFGTYKCVCKWGYVRDGVTSQCVHSKIVEILRSPEKDNLDKNVERNEPLSLIKLTYQLFEQRQLQKFQHYFHEKFLYFKETFFSFVNKYV